MLKLSFGTLRMINLPFSLQLRERVIKSIKKAHDASNEFAFTETQRLGKRFEYVHFADTDQLQGLHTFRSICLENVYSATKERYPGSLTILLHG
jgi:hypothetical protein